MITTEGYKLLPAFRQILATLQRRKLWPRMPLTSALHLVFPGLRQDPRSDGSGAPNPHCPLIYRQKRCWQICRSSTIGLILHFNRDRSAIFLPPPPTISVPFLFHKRGFRCSVGAAGVWGVCLAAQVGQEVTSGRKKLDLCEKKVGRSQRRGPPFSSHSAAFINRILNPLSGSFQGSAGNL